MGDDDRPTAPGVNEEWPLRESEMHWKVQFQSSAAFLVVGGLCTLSHVCARAVSKGKLLLCSVVASSEGLGRDYAVKVVSCERTHKGWTGIEDERSRNAGMVTFEYQGISIFASSRKRVNGMNI